MNRSFLPRIDADVGLEFRKYLGFTISTLVNVYALFQVVCETVPRNCSNFHVLGYVLLFTASALAFPESDTRRELSFDTDT